MGYVVCFIVGIFFGMLLMGVVVNSFKIGSEEDMYKYGYEQGLKDANKEE